ncbi:MAG: hypothetical protein HOH74_27995, partial [Gemmatimonadetes bacterium]|nr:hypothetical protein [Gemmatimonadota bacterium]
MEDTRLSAHGSDRATAYNFSNKILRHEQGLLVSWLEAPSTQDGPTRIQLGVCDAISGQLQKAMTLGEGIDNHCGLSMLRAPDGRVHAFMGAHHGAFLHRWSDDPADPAAWSAPEAVGPSASYPAVVLDRQGMFHLVYRVSYRGEGETWQLEYVRKPAGGSWSVPVVLAKCPVPGYSHFMHSLSVGPTGALHVTLQFHYAVTGSAKQGKTKLAAHLRSDDDGDHWTSEGESCELPVTIQNARPIVSCLEDEEASIRIGTHVVDADDQPWLFCAMAEAPFGVMLHRTEAGWQRTDLDAACPDLNFVEGRSTATSRDASGRVHLLISTAAQGAGQGWYHPANELHHFAFEPDGRIQSHRQLTPDDPAHARWLPSIEFWNWQDPEHSCAEGHWYTYTHGLNA